MLVLGVVALVVLSLLVLCEIVSYASTKSPPGAEPARRLRAPWTGSAHVGSGARGEEGTGASTARARGTSPALLLSRAVQRPAAQWAPLGWRR